MTHLTISIASYNDEEIIESVVRDSLEVLSKITDSYAVFVINDGSADNTQSVLDRICRENSKVRCLRHPQNLGFGPTIREIFTLPDCEWVFILPGDGQISPFELLKLYPYIKDRQFILGYRKNRRDHWLQKFNFWCYNWMVTLVAGKRVRDVDSVALAKKSILNQMQLKSRTAFIHSEIFLEALKKGASFIEVEIEHKPRLYGKGSGNRWKVIRQMFAGLAKYALGMK